jgi:hypothetical protein
MVAVGNNQLPVFHLIAHGGQYASIGDLPDAMDDAIFVGDLDVDVFIFVVPALVVLALVLVGIELGVHFAGSAVEHEDLAEVGASRAQQVEAIGFGLGQGLFVAENDMGGILLDATEADEATPFGSQLTSRNREFLGIKIEGRLRILPQNACLAPVLERSRGTGVNIFALAVPGQRLPENNPN